MSELRVNETILIIGRRQTGKTTFTKEKLIARQSQKTLVVDTFDHPSYREFKELHPDRIIEWQKKVQKGLYRVYQGNPISNLETLFTNVYDAFLILEDAAKYLDSNIPRSVKQGFIDHRNRGLDLAIMFHNFSDVAPYIVKMCNRIVLFRTNDNLQIPQHKFYNWNEIEERQQRIRTLIDKGQKPAWYNETIIMQ
jgi:hypothetical protein